MYYPIDRIHLGKMKLDEFKAKAGISPNAKTEPGQLIVRRALTKDRGEYLFDLREGTNNTDLAGESKLSEGDSFFITHYALGVMKVDETGVAGVAKVGNFPVQYFPDANYFLGKDAGTGVTEAECLELIYGVGAKLKLSNGSDNRFTDRSTNVFRTVPNRPHVIANGTQVGASPSEYNFEDVFKQLHPMFGVMSKDQFTLSLAPGVRDLIGGGVDGAGAATTTKNHVVLQLEGYFIRDSASALNNIISKSRGSC